MRPLREHEAETLEDLRATTWRGNYIQPREIGGRDSSHHGRTLAKLCRRGLAERVEGGGIIKTSWRYRAALTAEERHAREERDAQLRALSSRRRDERRAARAAVGGL
jgi:hypothetical protein